MSAPYKGASSDSIMSTVSRAIIHGGNVIAVMGADIKLSLFHNMMPKLCKESRSGSNYFLFVLFI